MDAVVAKEKLDLMEITRRRIHSAPDTKLAIDLILELFDPQRSPVMRNLSDALLNSKIHFRLLMLVAVVFTLAALTPLSSASAPSLTITVVNNSGWEIRHLYLSPADNDNWGPNQLNESSISPGATRTLNVSWDQSTVKLVAEDQDGCFLSSTVNVASNIEWTITNDSPRNCGN
jgi:hypothetical protein